MFALIELIAIRPDADQGNRTGHAANRTAMLRQSIEIVAHGSVMMRRRHAIVIKRFDREANRAGTPCCIGKACARG
jgi:hypothetical protein